MTKDNMLTDREKLELWDTICIKNGWSSVNEMDRWLKKYNIYFTGTGSCVNYGFYLLLIENQDNTKVVVNGSEIEELTTFVYQSLSGILIFASVDAEKAFWKHTHKRFKEEFNQDIPSELVPKYLHKSVYNNSSNDDEGPDGGQNFDNLPRE